MTAVTLFGKSTLPGDTAVLVDSSGRFILSASSQSLTVDTELPAARLAANALALPTAPDVLATLLASNGTTLDMLRQDSTGALRNSLYFKASAAGDTPITGVSNLNSSGRNPIHVMLCNPFGDAGGNGRGYGDGVSMGGSDIDFGAYNMLWNGATTDRQRNNVETNPLLSSAARVGTTPTGDQTNYNAKAVLLFLDVTATPNDAQTLTVNFQVKDPTSAKYVTITAFTALVASALGATPTTATFVYTISPGGAETAAVANHEVQSLVVPRTWRANIVHSAGGSWTYTLSCCTVV